MTRIMKTLLVVGLLSMLSLSALAQDADNTEEPSARPVGALLGEHEGYTLVTANGMDVVFLIDDQGRLIHQWETDGAGRDAFLRENGNLVVSVPGIVPSPDPYGDVFDWIDSDGRIQEYTWDGELVWEYLFDRSGYAVHHGIKPMPNGNVLFIAWEQISDEEAIANGRDPELLGDRGYGLWPDVILEYSPQEDDIVWEWRAWDHIIQDFDPDKLNYGSVEDNPQLIDLNYDGSISAIEDWMHSNAVDYNPNLNQIAISVREFNEVWIIDRNTTTEEAAGEAGNLLYRWGNPLTYKRGSESDHYVNYQHDVQWIPEGYPGAGNILLYSNRHTYTLNQETRSFSQIIEFEPPLNEDGTYAIKDGQPFGPQLPTWTYNGFPDNMFSSAVISGTQRLRNGNTLIIPGTDSRIMEVTPDGDIAWDYVMPVNGAAVVRSGSPVNARIFRSRRYAPDFPAFDGRELTPGKTLEELAGTVSNFPLLMENKTPLSSAFSISLDNHYYTFMPTETDRYLSVRVTSTEPDFDPYVTLLSADFEILREDDNSGGDNNAYILPDQPLQGNEFIIEVSTSPDSESSTVGEYEILVEQNTSIFDYVGEGIPQLAYGTSLTDAITTDDPQSMYAFYGNEGDTVNLEMARSNENLIPALELTDLTDTVLAASGEAGEARTAIEGFTLPRNGLYIIRATRFDGDDEATETTGVFEFTLEQAE